MTVDERCVRVSAHDILGKDEEEQEPERTLGPSKDTVVRWDNSHAPIHRLSPGLQNSMLMAMSL